MGTLPDSEQLTEATNSGSREPGRLGRGARCGLLFVTLPVTRGPWLPGPGRVCVHSASRTLQLHAALSHAAPCAALVQGPQDFAALNKSVPTRLLLC